MRVLILFVGILYSLPLLKGQTTMSVMTDSGRKTIVADTSEACNPNEIFTVVPVGPVYEGGIEKLMAELNTNMNIDQSIKGVYSVYFSINCRDKAYGFQTVRGVDETLDEKIIELLSIQQNWTSAIHRNEKVDCVYVVTLRIKKGKIRSSK